MRIGVTLADFGGTETLAERVDAVRATAAEGFATVWVNHGEGVDALTLLAVAGGTVTGTSLGTAVIPVYGRHPLVLAQQAWSVQAALDVPLLLGLGASHAAVVEGVLGVTDRRPARDVRRFVTALGAHLDAAPGGGRRPAVLLAAGGPTMLSIAAELADGVLATLTTAETYRDVLVPAVAAAAARAGRDAPPVVATELVCVTGDRDAWLAANPSYAGILDSLELYRAVVARQGLSSAADAFLVGDEAFVRERVERMREAGVGELNAVLVGDEEGRLRTRAVLRSLV